MSGYIKLHRRIKDNKLWGKEPFTKIQAWIDLLLRCQWKATEVMDGMKVIPLSPGECIVSMRGLAKEWKWSENKVRRYVKWLKNDGMIEYTGGCTCTHLKVLKWKDFQYIEDENERTPERSDERTRVAPTADIQEDKKLRSEEERPTTGRIERSDIEWTIGLEIQAHGVLPNTKTIAEHLRVLRQRGIAPAEVAQYCNDTDVAGMKIWEVVELRWPIDMKERKAQEIIRRMDEQDKRLQNGELT